jgi:hypothetical protein
MLEQSLRFTKLRGIANTAYANGLNVAQYVQHQGDIFKHFDYKASSRTNSVRYSEIPQSPPMQGSLARSL